MCTKKSTLISFALAGLLAVFGAAAQDTPQTETQLIAALTGDGDWFAKQAACRALRQAGTAKSVPALAALLDDPRLSHWARYALEPMSAPEAGDALRKALDSTTGSQQMGVVISLGVRRDVMAVKRIVPLLRVENVDRAKAAAGALGRIGGNEAIDALRASYDDATGGVRDAVAEGLLRAAKHLADTGNAAAAVALYQELLEKAPARHIELGAFRGLAYADPAHAPELLLAAIAGEDAVLAGLAAQTIAETSGAPDTERYAAALAELPPAAQPVLLRALAGRGDDVARPAVVKLAKSEDTEVRIAALKALAPLGTLADAPLLVASLASEDAREAEAARTALVGLRGDDVDPSLTRLLSGVSGGEQAGLLTVLMNRMAPQTLRMAVYCFEEGGTSARLAALDVFALMGGADQIPLTLAAMREDTARAAGERALLAMCVRHGAAALPPVLAAMKGAGTAQHKTLLGALARIATPEALSAVTAAIDDADREVAAEAVRTLSNWQTADAAPALLKLAESSALQRNVLGLRGYLRLARDVAPRDERAGMLRRATGLARRPEELRLVVGAWGTVKTREALDALLTHLEREDLRDEAALAIVDVSSVLGKRAGESEAVRAALRRVIATCKDEDIVKTARRALNRIPGQ